MKEGFFLYCSFFEPVRGLKDEQLGQLFRAIFSNRVGEEYEITDAAVAMAYKFIEAHLDAMDKRSEARSNAGRLGGMSKQTEATSSNLKQKVFAKFFLRNFVSPEQEVERFWAWGESTGWKNKSGQPIDDIIAYSSFWRPQETGRFSVQANRLLVMAYELAEQAGDSEAQEAILSTFLAQTRGGGICYITRSENAQKMRVFVQNANNSSFRLPVCEVERGGFDLEV